MHTLISEPNKTSKIAAGQFGSWRCSGTPAGAVGHPDQLGNTNDDWLDAVVPGTVAAALQAAGKWNLHQPLDADSQDWWYQTTFASPDAARCILCFDGLATLAEVWLNGRLVLTTDNMFRAYRIDVAECLEPENELVIAFRSLAEDLKQKRPRPRWKTNLVNHQQLRWRRATLLGRMPGWSPPVPPIGPWRGVRLDTDSVSISDVRVITRIEGNVGVVSFSAHVDAAIPIERTTLHVGDHKVLAQLTGDQDGKRLQGELRIENPPLWWPHTHGEQPLLECAIEIQTAAETRTIRCRDIGFRTVRALPGDEFGIEVNGVPIFCRGACWTISDIVKLDGSEQSLRHDLELARDAGANMLRIGGTMVYESDRFYDLCDELGILIWQDFMFANMDYPVDDPAFADNIEAEARYQLGRLAGHPSVVAYCGNSEVEQQAAMLGMPREHWRNRWFGDRLPSLCAEYHSNAIYVPSTPSGGVLPFHTRTGVTHYYGVGAYLRPVDEVRKADVKFTPECLGFSNVPEPETIGAILEGEMLPPHHPKWKERVPRDTGPGWDFEDVRDHYLQQFFGVDAVKMRSFDLPRYLQLSRVVSGEIMSQVFSEWRGAYSHNHGALVWFFKDLWAAAGWGIVDSLGLPKGAYYYLRRVWQPRQITMSDEGLDGLHLHVINETAEALTGRIELVLLKDQHIVVGRGESPCAVPPRSKQVVQSDALLDGFHDVAYAYRFGPPKHEVAIATLYDSHQQVISEAFHFLEHRDLPRLAGVHLEATAESIGDGCFRVALQSDRFLQSVSFDASGYLPEDNYFHLAPGRQKIVLLRPRNGSDARFRAHVEALNLQNPVKISMKSLVS